MAESQKVEVVCAGLSVVNFPVFPVDEGIFQRDLTPVSPIELLPGGDAANQAVVLSRLGVRAALCSRRGNDGFGDMMISLLVKHGREINLDSLAVDPLEATSVCAMMIRPDGQRHFCSHKGAIRNFCFADVDLEILAEVKVASIGGLYGLPSFDGQGSAAFFRFAREHGAITVADTKFDQFNLGLNGILETLRHTDYFFPSFDEASAISGEKEPERIAKVFLDAGAAHVGIKLGVDGIYAADGKNAFYVPAFPVKAVDTTGAGDNFMSGFIAGLVRGLNMRDSCVMGTAAASLCVENVGPTAGAENMEQLSARMKEIKLGGDSHENSGHN